MVSLEGFEPISLPKDLIGTKSITPEGFGSELFRCVILPGILFHSYA